MPVVLVADDDRKLRVLFMDALQKAGYGVVEATDGVDAWQNIEDKKAEALVVDVGFDREAGREMLGRLSLSKRRFPVVALCEYSYPTDNLPGLQRMKILSKPVPPEQVAVALATVLKKK